MDGIAREETRAQWEARVYTLVKEISHIGLQCQYDMCFTKNSIKVRKGSNMGRALGLWLLGVPVFIIILLYLFRVI